jgi:hypothetical protein
MSPRKICFIVALLFITGFCVSLTFDWHGAFAVFFAIGFFIFVSGSTRNTSPARRVIGGILFAFSILSLIGSLHQNLIFVFTVATGGIILFFNPIALFTRKTDSNRNT